MKKIIIIFALVIVMMSGATLIEVGYGEDLDYSWGKIAKNGLQLGVKLPQRAFSKEKPLIVKLALRNTSNEKVATPFQEGWEWYGVEFIVFQDGKIVERCFNRGNIVGPRAEKFIILSPGEMISGDVNDAKSWKGLYPLHMLEEGTYSLKVEFSYVYPLLKYLYEVGDKLKDSQDNTIVGFEDIIGESGVVNFSIVE